MRFLFLLFLLITYTIQAQNVSNQDTATEITIAVGQKIKIAPCPKKGFSHIDYFVKTRIEPNTPGYDSVSGDGFYKSFFTTGDFDVQKLPCTLAKKKYTIIAMETLTNKNTKQPARVIFLKGPQANSVLWVDLDAALENSEIVFD